MKSNNTSISSKLAALLAGAALLGLVSQSALAVGTTSGTAINNMALLSYSVGGTAQNQICSSITGNSTGNGATSGSTCTAGTNGAVATSFVVDNKVNLTVSLPVNLTTVPGTTKQALSYTVTNLGNTAQRYALTAIADAGATIVTMSTVKIYLDNGATAGVWDATDTAYVDASTFGDVAPGGTLKILIIADTPITAINGQTAIFDLQAQTVNAGTTTATTQSVIANTAGVDVVFADIATSGLDAADIARDGMHSVSATYTVGSSVLSVVKTVTVLCDPYNGGGGATVPKNVPGAFVQYAITISNTGVSAATLGSVTDTLPATLGFDTKLINGVGAPATASTTCASATGLTQSPTGFNAVRGAGVGPGYVFPGPGTVAHATTAGATIAGQAITIDFTTLAGTAYGAVAPTLAAGTYVTVYFNAFVQ